MYLKPILSMQYNIYSKHRYQCPRLIPHAGLGIRVLRLSPLHCIGCSVFSGARGSYSERDWLPWAVREPERSSRTSIRNLEELSKFPWQFGGVTVIGQSTWLTPKLKPTKSLICLQLLYTYLYVHVLSRPIVKAISLSCWKGAFPEVCACLGHYNTVMFIFCVCRYAEVLILVIFILLALLWLTREPKFIPGWGKIFQTEESGKRYIRICIIITCML